MNKNELEIKVNLPEILGTPKTGIIFSDLDGVWFNEGANFASPPPSDLRIIQEAQAEGFWVILVSDTGSKTLASFAEELGCMPVVIGENGASIFLPKENIITYLTPIKPFFDKYKVKALETLKRNNPQASIINGDATAIIKAGTLKGNPGELMYFIGDTRECSFGAYTRVADTEGKPVVDDEKTEGTESTLKSLLGINNGVIVKRYPAIGSCLVKDPTIVKWKAVEWFMNQFPQSLSFYMLGDTVNDSMEPIAEKITTCAVGNATEELKMAVSKTGGIVAPDSAIIAKGANYIIKQIMQKGGKR